MPPHEVRSMPLMGKSGEASLVADGDATYPAIDARGGPGTPFPPTYLFIIGFIVGWWINRFVPLAIGGPAWFRFIIGGALTAIGLALFWWGMATFYRIRTGIMLQRAATELVNWGPYSWSRNPMYVGFVAGYLGLALLFNTVWPLLFLPFVILTLIVMVISREERYLRRTFGAEYEAYCERVGRWV